MSRNNELARLRTGVPNLDELLAGGLPEASLVVIAGPPGAGKSILAHQISFFNARRERPVLFFNTLSEPTMKTLLHLSQFDFFDAALLDAKLVNYVDIGGVLRNDGLAAAAQLIIATIKQLKPAIVVIDSFKVFEDLAHSHAELRKFSYELAVNLTVWQTTTFLLGEFGPEDIATNPLFSIIDGMIIMSQRERSGEQQRVLQIVKMRGTNHNRDAYTFEISTAGVNIFAPRLTARRKPTVETVPTPRMRTEISKLDELLGEGIPLGSSLLISGTTGTGKTVLLLEFLYRGALRGEKGILFSFEETEERLRAAANGLGWNIDRFLHERILEIVFIPQPDISIEKHLAMVQRHIDAMGARRVAVDSISVFLHRAQDAEVSREKVFQLASLVQNAQAVGFFATDIPYGSGHISRYGVEETVVDGVILLSASEEGFERKRYLEVYKLRNSAHLKGRHEMVIAAGGVKVFPRYYAAELLDTPPPPLDVTKRLATGVAGLDPLLGGGIFERSVTLVSGSAGIGKSTLALQFALEGARRAEKALFVALEEGPEQIIAMGAGLGLTVAEAVGSGMLEIIYLSRQSARANQLLSSLGDRIVKEGIRRVVIDSAGQILTEGLHPADLRQMLFALAARFKALGVTTLLTLEAHMLFASDWSTEEGFSPVADNLIMLRYEKLPGELCPVITVVKTRNSPHDAGTHVFTVGPGGAAVGERFHLPLRRPTSGDAPLKPTPRTP